MRSFGQGRAQPGCSSSMQLTGTKADPHDRGRTHADMLTAAARQGGPRKCSTVGLAEGAFLQASAHALLLVDPAYCSLFHCLYGGV